MDDEQQDARSGETNDSGATRAETANAAASQTPVYDSLSARDRRFVDAYLVYYNGAEAYRRSGGTSPNGFVMASRKLSRVNIQEAIRERQRQAGISREEITARVAAIAAADIGDLFVLEVPLDADGNPLGPPEPVPNWPKLVGPNRDPNLSRLVKSIKMTRAGLVLELHDQVRAAELAARFQGMLTDNLNVTNTQQADALNSLAAAITKTAAVATGAAAAGEVSDTDAAAAWLDAHRNDDLSDAPGGDDGCD